MKRKKLIDSYLNDAFSTFFGKKESSSAASTSAQRPNFEMVPKGPANEVCTFVSYPVGGGNIFWLSRPLLQPSEGYDRYLRLLVDLMYLASRFFIRVV